MDLCIVGAGRVGLVTGACLAELGNNVVCVDQDAEKIVKLQQGITPFYEPNLDELVSRNVADNCLSFTTDLRLGIEQSEIIFICVGTSSSSGETDLSALEKVTKRIGYFLNGRKTIVIKSTVPNSFGDQLSLLIKGGMAKSERKYDFEVVFNPEFLREGFAVADTFHPDRIVVGSVSYEAIRIMRELYKPIIDQSFPATVSSCFKQNIPFITTDPASAQMIKYAANAFLAVKISFINEIANLCEKVGADVNEVAYGIGCDQRIGHPFLRAGLGWGGSCLPKDTLSLCDLARKYGGQSLLINAARKVNEQQRISIIFKLQKELGALEGKTVGLLGLSFKPDTDDVRNAPSLAIAEQLIKHGARVKAYDPVVERISNPLSFKLLYCSNSYEVAQGSHALVVATEWEEFKRMNLSEVKKRMKIPLIVDGRNIFEAEEVQAAGFKYLGVGR